MSHKSILDKITSRDHARRSSPHLRLGGDNTCSTQNRTCHLQQVGNKSRVREGTQLVLPDENQKYDTKDHARLYMVGLA
jgi:hypothetical protein